MLFTTRKKMLHGPRTGHRVPAFLKRLHVLCPHRDVHALPVRMVCIGESTSHRGEPMAIFGCPFAGCRWREGWIPDRVSGRPFRLWAGLHNGG